MYDKNNRMREMLKSDPIGLAAKFFAAQKSRIVPVGGVLFFAYLCATVTSSFMVSILMEGAVSKAVAETDSSSQKTQSLGEEKLNYVQLRKAVMARNVFNSTGEIPDESDLESSGSGERKVFDPAAKCEKSKLPITLLGTIFMGSEETSIATVKETGFDEADIYRVGDFIAGVDGAQVMSVGRKRVVINNNGVKECLEIDEKVDNRLVPSYESPAAGEGDGSVSTPGGTGEPIAESEGGIVTLDGGYVEGELGDGFSKIISAARLVPNMEDNKVNGFKIFAINTASLFGKVGLRNGDIITQVNDVSLKLPEQGFALYEAFQDEREITIHVLRGGQTPRTLSVKIK